MPYNASGKHTLETQNPKYDAASLEAYDGRIFLRVKGYDARFKKVGWIRVALTPNGVSQLLAAATQAAMEIRGQVALDSLIQSESDEAVSA